MFSPIVPSPRTLLGNFVVTWNSQFQDGSGYGVFGQLYRPIVPVELMRFGVRVEGTAGPLGCGAGPLRDNGRS